MNLAETYLKIDQNSKYMFFLGFNVLISSRNSLLIEREITYLDILR